MKRLVPGPIRGEHRSRDSRSTQRAPGGFGFRHVGLIIFVSFFRLGVNLRSDSGRAMNDLMSRSGPVVARVYAALVYVASLALLFAAAVLTSTHAREAFIFVFLPGVLLAVMSRFIWT